MNVLRQVILLCSNPHPKLEAHPKKQKARWLSGHRAKTAIALARELILTAAFAKGHFACIDFRQYSVCGQAHGFFGVYSRYPARIKLFADAVLLVVSETTVLHPFFRA